jgi:hypothetical protein
MLDRIFITNSTILEDSCHTKETHYVVMKLMFVVPEVRFPDGGKIAKQDCPNPFGTLKQGKISHIPCPNCQNFLIVKQGHLI